MCPASDVKMHLLALIIGVGLLSPALTLTCFYCQPGTTSSCSSTAICPFQGYRCSSGRLVTTAGTVELPDMYDRGCAPPELCTEASVNYGVSRSAQSYSCCTTDRCNTQPGPRPSKNSPNGKKCYQCDGYTCKASLNCLGTEDYCITSTVSEGGVTQTLKGCASKVLCDALPNSLLTRNLTKNTVHKCCQGDLCNGAVSVSAGLLLLVAPLLAKLLL